MIIWSSKSFLSGPGTVEMSSPIEIRSDQKEGVSIKPLSTYFFLRNIVIGVGYSGGGLGYFIVPYERSLVSY